MPEPRLRRLLGALLPARLRQDVFEPAAHDLDGARLRAGRGRAHVGLLLLFMDCWRLAPAEVASMFLNDLRHAFRLLVRDPGFTLAAVLTLTLGVGANVAVFAVFNAVLLRPMPYADADRLVMIEHRDRRTGVTKPFIAVGDFVDLHDRQELFEAVGAYDTFRTVVHGDQEPLDASGLAVTPDLLSALRVVPFAGRAIEAADVREGAAPVVMLGYEFWQSRFAGDPSIVGRSVRIGSTPVARQVIGIAPAGFRFPAAATTDVVFPRSLPAAAPAVRKNGWTFAAARLAPGVTADQASVHLAALSRQMEQEHPEQNAGSEYFAIPVREAMIGPTGPALVLALAAVTIVLLIACANVANLLAARSLSRRHEMALRAALGAGRRQIGMQLAAEALALASVAGVAAVLFAYWATPALVRLVPPSLNLTALGEVRLDPAVLGFAALVTLGTTVIFTLFSGMAAGDRGPAPLTAPGRVSTGTGVRRATSALVAAEIALAIVLVAGAGLVLRSFAHLVAVDPGFTPAGVLTLSVSVPADRYRDADARVTLQRRLFDALGAVPGVEAAGAAAVTPLTGNNWTVPFERADQPVPAGQRPPDVGWQSATGGYFRALNIPLRAGRLFSFADGPAAPPVVIVSEALAARFFPGESPVGRKIRIQDGTAEIVGVVGNIRRAALTDTPHADLYFPQERAPGTATTLFVRTSGDPAAILPAVRTALRQVEPAAMLRGIRSMDEVVRESMQVTRLALSLLALFAATALALAAVGIYGVMAYTVRQRMREIGTRLALGATRGNILWLVLRQGGRIALLGTAAGLAITVVAGRAIRSLLFSTTPGDPVILGCAALLLLATALAACYIPARRATRVDPVQTLAGG
jgi:putative ABC transport system permease protein